MQEIKYINLAGETVTFGNGPPFVFASVKGTEGAGLTRKTLKTAMLDGERTLSLLRGGRELEVTFHVITYSREDLYRVRAALSGALGAERGFDRATGERGKIVYTNDFGQWWTWAVPSKPPQWPKRILDLHPSVKISFECDSAYWYAMEENQGGFTVSKEGFTLPFAFPVKFGSREMEVRLMNKGHAPAPVRMTVHGAGETPALVNRTTGASLRFTSPLPQGAVLEIHTDPEDLYVRIVEAGERRNAYGYLDVATPISGFCLAVGENVIAYEAGGAAAKTSMHVTWTDRFEGV